MKHRGTTQASTQALACTFQSKGNPIWKLLIIPTVKQHQNLFNITKLRQIKDLHALYYSDWPIRKTNRGHWKQVQLLKLYFVGGCKGFWRRKTMTVSKLSHCNTPMPKAFECRKFNIYITNMSYCTMKINLISAQSKSNQDSCTWQNGYVRQITVKVKLCVCEPRRCTGRTKL